MRKARPSPPEGAEGCTLHVLNVVDSRVDDGPPSFPVRPRPLRPLFARPSKKAVVTYRSIEWAVRCGNRLIERSPLKMCILSRAVKNVPQMPRCGIAYSLREGIYAYLSMTCIFISQSQLQQWLHLQSTAKPLFIGCMIPDCGRVHAMRKSSFAELL